MKVRVFTSLSALPESIVRVSSFPAVPNFFLSQQWFSCLYETSLKSSFTPRIYCLYDDDERVVAMLYCATEDRSRTLSGLSNFYSMEFAPVHISSAALHQQSLEHLAHYIRSERPRWNVIELRLLVNQSGNTADLRRALQRNGFFFSQYFMYENWYLRVDGRNFDEYFSGLSSRLRNTISRKERKLGRKHRFYVEIFTKDDDRLAKAIAEYSAIYEKSWKQQEPFSEFIPALARTAAQLGILRLGVMYVDDIPAAAQLWLTTEHRALIYKLAYDEGFREYSPGSILSREMFRQAIDEDHVQEIDYGVGSDAYKKDWMDSKRELIGIRALNKYTLLGRTQTAYEKMKNVLRVSKPTSQDED